MVPFKYLNTHWSRTFSLSVLFYTPASNHLLKLQAVFSAMSLRLYPGRSTHSQEVFHPIICALSPSHHLLKLQAAFSAATSLKLYPGTTHTLNGGLPPLPAPFILLLAAACHHGRSRGAHGHSEAIFCSFALVSVHFNLIHPLLCFVARSCLPPRPLSLCLWALRGSLQLQRAAP